MEPSPKCAEVSLAQRVRCATCRAFVDVVGGIRGENFEGEGRRHFYTVQRATRRSRCGPRFGVSPAFFRGVFNASHRWVAGHPYFEEQDFAAHLAAQDLPSWVSSLIRDVDFERIVGRDAAVTVCAVLLGVSRQQVYAQLA